MNMARIKLLQQSMAPPRRFVPSKLQFAYTKAVCDRDEMPLLDVVRPPEPLRLFLTLHCG